MNICSFRPNFQEPKNLYIQSSQPLLTSQISTNQQFSYSNSQNSINQPLTSSIQNIPTQPIHPQNFYVYNNGSSSIISQPMIYSSLPGEATENDKFNQKNNFQLRKLKKARLKRQKKAEYIDFLEQRISQLDRIIKQHNLTYVEPLPDSEKKPEITSDNNNINASANLSNEEKLKRDIVSNEQDIEDFNNTLSPNKRQKVEPCKTNNTKKNVYEFENDRFECFILLQGHTLDTDITLNLTK
eukprot:jgi/Orpsp1_1/1187121/evm.model.d7180000055551.1